MYMMYFLPSPHFAKSVPCSVSLAFVCSYKFLLSKHATCPTHVAKYSGIQFGAARAGQKEKIKKYADIAKHSHADFIPFVVETSGAFTKESEKLIDHIISTCAEHQQLWEPKEVRREFLGAIAIAVQRGNASAMFER